MLRVVRTVSSFGVSSEEKPQRAEWGRESCQGELGLELLVLKEGQRGIPARRVSWQGDEEMETYLFRVCDELEWGPVHGLGAGDREPLYVFYHENDITKVIF